MAGKVGGSPHKVKGQSFCGLTMPQSDRCATPNSASPMPRAATMVPATSKCAVIAGEGACGERAACSTARHEIDRHDGEGEPESRRVHDDAQDQGRERRKRGRAGDGAERDGALPSLVERRDQAEHRGRDKADAESRDNASAPGEREDVGGERRHHLAQHGQGQPDGQCAPQADRHADEPAGDHERAGDEREQRGRHLDIVEGGAQRAHQARRRKVHRRAVTRGADLGESENDQGRVVAFAVFPFAEWWRRR